MEGNSFWLIYIQDDQVSVSLISQENKTFRVSAIGPQKPWDSFDSSILVKAIDESLSVASLNANITEEQEPSNAAFVVPPFWVGSDGKIIASKLKLIKDTCKNLSFTPSGFLAEDEALVEESTRDDGFPASFILLHLSGQEFYLSLVYLGHIKERIKKGFDGEFTGQILESAILEFKTESTLPPQIIVFGQADQQIIESLKNFAWVGKKNIETFLHYPDIKLYSDNQIITTFTKVISNQITPHSVASEEFSTDIESNQNLEEASSPMDSENTPQSQEIEEDQLTEVSPQEIGFSIPQETPTPEPLPVITPDQLPPSLDLSNEPNLDPFEPPVVAPPTLPGKHQKIKFSLNFFKKIKPIRFNRNLLWLLFALLPFIIIIPFFLISSQIILFITPYQFNKSIPVTLSTSGSINDLNKSIIPVQKETVQVAATASVETTGQKTIGERAKGEITIYNKLDTSQSIAKGKVLTDSSGRKFELISAVSVEASSSDLEEGVINLGKTKTSVSAVDIGPESNLATDTQLTFADYPTTSIIAKVESTFTGGTRQQIRAVSSEDKTNVQSKINEQIVENIDQEVSQKVGDITGVIKGTVQSQKSNLELSREVGEAADELTGTVNATVTVFVLSDNIKDQIIKYFLESETGFNDIDYQSSNFSLSFEISEIEDDQATGNLTISGNSLPKINIAQIQKALAIKTITQANSLIKKLVPRAYNFHINTNLPLLPFRSDNINIEIKTESL